MKPRIGLFLFFLTCFCKVSNSQTIHIDIRAYSEGFYRDDTHSMVAVADPVHYPQICDTVVFGLIDSVTNLPVYCSHIVLNTDGFGFDDVPSVLVGESVFPYVRFRNTLGIYSRQTVILNGSVNNFDLTDISFATNNCNQDYGVAKAFGGEIVQDGVVDPNDFLPYDIDNSNGAMGYLVTDLNGDGFVDANDFPIFDINNANGSIDPHWFNCTSSDIEEVKSNSIQFGIFPNPSVESIKLNLTGEVFPVQINILNSVGSCIFAKACISESDLKIDISRWPSGYYTVVAPGTNRFGRFIKY